MRKMEGKEGWCGMVLRCLILLMLSFLLNAKELVDDNENVIPTVIQVPRGQSHDLSFIKNIGEIFIEDPKVVDIQVLGARRIRLFTLDVGMTRVVINDRIGNRILEFKVEVTPNVAEVEEIIRELFPHVKIHLRAIKHVIFVTGKVADPKTADEIIKIIKAYVKEDEQVINNLEISLPTQVMIRVKIAEVKRVVSQNLGIDWAMFTQNKGLDAEGNVANVVDKGLTAGLIGTAEKMDLSQIGKAAADAFPIKALFSSGAGGGGGGSSGGGSSGGSSGGGSGGGKASGGIVLNLTRLRNGFSHNVSALIDTMASESLATILAEPTLIALSGQTATFNAGGEEPYQTSYNNTSNTEFKSYGISLNVTPTVISENLINLKINPNISDLGVRTEMGPAIESRGASTVVELADGQSIVIAGLLKKNMSNASSASSWLAKLPIIGSLFKANSDSNNETELVIVVTAYIVRPITGKVATPVDNVKLTDVTRQALFGEMNVKTTKVGEPDDDKIMHITREYNGGRVDHRTAITVGAGS